MGVATVKVICPTCGKPYTVRKFCHTRADGDQFAAYVQANTRSCPTCYHSMVNQEAFATAQELGLPPLVGTLAQIKWATVIRHRLISDMLTGGAPTKDGCRIWAQHTDAAWWIRNRDTIGPALSLNSGKVIYMQDHTNAIECQFDDFDEVID